MFALTHFGMLSLGGFLFQNALAFNILQKHHPPTPQPESNTQPQRRLPRKYGTPESPSTRNRGEEAYQGRRAHEPKGAQYQQVIITARAEPPQKWRVGTAPTQNFLIINVLQQYHRAELSPNIFQAFILHSGLVILLTKLHPSAWSILNDCRYSSSISVTSVFSPLSAIYPELLLYSEPHESIPCEQAHQESSVIHLLFPISARLPFHNPHLSIRQE